MMIVGIWQGVGFQMVILLAALQDVLRKKTAEEPQLKSLLPLQLETGFPPRLWLDNISYVIMEPDPRTYRLVRQAPDGHLRHPVTAGHGNDRPPRKKSRIVACFPRNAWPTHVVNPR